MWLLLIPICLPWFTRWDDAERCDAPASGSRSPQLSEAAACDGGAFGAGFVLGRARLSGGTVLGVGDVPGLREPHFTQQRVGSDGAGCQHNVGQ